MHGARGPISWRLSLGRLVSRFAPGRVLSPLSAWGAPSGAGEFLPKIKRTSQDDTLQLVKSTKFSQLEKYQNARNVFFGEKEVRNQQVELRI